MANKATNATAQAFKALHIPGNPVLLANIYDATSARIIGSLPNCHALATASAAVAPSVGTSDPQLSLSTHLAALGPIAATARELAKPLTVDLQDGYGDDIEAAIRGVIALGAVGANIEDSDRVTSAMLDADVAVERIRRAVKAAAEDGVPDFVVNARSDTWFRGGTAAESVRRGKLYLEAGATTVYVLQPKGFKVEELREVVQELGGRVNIGARLPPPGQAAGTLTVQDLAEMGVARVSVGPQMYFAMEKALKGAAEQILGKI